MLYFGYCRFIGLIISISILVGCSSSPTQQPRKAVEIEPSIPQFESADFSFGYGDTSSWYKRFYNFRDSDLEFVRIFSDSPVLLRLVQDTSLDKIRNATFWGYALRYKPQNKYLPIYGKLDGTGIDNNTDKLVNIQYSGYFKLYNFKKEPEKEATSLKFLNASLVGFAGERTVKGASKHVFSNLVTHANRCEWQYDFWDSSRRFLGTRYDKLLSFHAESGLEHTLNGESWTIYTQMPKEIILDLESPKKEIFQNLFKSIGELPRVKYKRRNYSTDYIECQSTHTYGGKKVGQLQHRYSVYYPRLTTFGIFSAINDRFSYSRNRNIYGAANMTYGTKSGDLSKFILMNRYEKWLAKSPLEDLSLSSYDKFYKDFLYAKGPNGELEFWKVDPDTPKEQVITRLFSTYSNKKVVYRLPVLWSDLQKLSEDRQIGVCNDDALLLGACDGTRYPTVIKAKDGNQIDFWISPSERYLYSWNLSKKITEVIKLEPLVGNPSDFIASRENFICEQLEGTLVSLDKRLQKPFISAQPFNRWYSQDVPYYISLIRQAREGDEQASSLASRYNDQERKGMSELRDLLNQAKKAEATASIIFCPDIKQLAAEYVPLVNDLYKETSKVMDTLWDDVRNQSYQLDRQVLDAVSDKRDREAEAWQRNFWVNTMSQMQQKVINMNNDINRITAQTNAMYQQALEESEARRQQKLKDISEVERKQREADLVRQSKNNVVIPASEAPKKTVTTGFQTQQSFNINVPNAVSLKDLEKQTTIGGSTQIAINTDGQSSTEMKDTDSDARVIKQGKRLLEGLAFCYRTKGKKEIWVCDGVVQRLADELDKALEKTGCKTPRKFEVLDNGRLYFCPDKKVDPSYDTGRRTWNRDISGWISIPSALLNQRMEYFE